MKHFKVPVVGGVLDIDYEYLQHGIQTSATECYVALRDGVKERMSWQAVTAEEFEQVKEQVSLPPA